MYRTAMLGLFGGALFAAGIAPAAAGQDFVLLAPGAVSNYSAVAYAYGTDIQGIGSYDTDSDTNFTPVAASANANYNDFGGYARVNTSYFSAEAFTRSYFGTGAGLAFAAGYFTVNEPVEIRIEWDFADELPYDPFVYSQIALSDYTNDTTMFFLSTGGPSTGVEMFPLVPGDRYALAMQAVAYEPGDTFTFASLVTADCFGDCDGNALFNVDDVECFVDGFLGGDLDHGDCTGNGVLNVDDVECFVDAFLTQCEP